MVVAPDQLNQFVTSGLYGCVRHPIMRWSILMMLAALVVVPTVPVAVMAALHRPDDTKIYNEERFLAGYFWRALLTLPAVPAGSCRACASPMPMVLTRPAPCPARDAGRLQSSSA